MKITVHFLGKPEIIRDGVRVVIPQKKIQALLLYLLFNESCSRDELAACSGRSKVRREPGEICGTACISCGHCWGMVFL